MTYFVHFCAKKFARIKKKQYFCIVFFMVLDFKVKKRLGCRETTRFFYIFFFFICIYHKFCVSLQRISK